MELFYLITIIQTKERCLNKNNNYPIHIALMRGYMDCLRILLTARDLRINAPNRQGDTPLHIAAGSGNYDAVNLLLGKGANPNGLDRQRSTPLHRAAEAGATDVIELLLSRSANINAQDAHRRTPLHRCLYYYPTSQIDPSDTVNFLMNRGADIYAVDDEGKIPLHVAAKFGCLESLKELLRLSDEGKNYQDRRGNSPLHLACYHGHLNCVSYLLSIGANHLLFNNARETPIDSAYIRHPECVVEIAKYHPELQEDLRGFLREHQPQQVRQPQQPPQQPQQPPQQFIRGQAQQQRQRQYGFLGRQYGNPQGQEQPDFAMNSYDTMTWEDFY